LDGGTGAGGVGAEVALPSFFALRYETICANSSGVATRPFLAMRVTIAFTSSREPLMSGKAHGTPARMGWGRLLKRTFDIDIEHCRAGGGGRAAGTRGNALR